MCLPSAQVRDSLKRILFTRVLPRALGMQRLGCRRRALHCIAASGDSPTPAREAAPQHATEHLCCSKYTFVSLILSFIAYLVNIIIGVINHPTLFPSLLRRGETCKGQLRDQATFSGGLYLPDYLVMDDFVHVTD